MPTKPPKRAIEEMFLSLDMVQSEYKISKQKIVIDAIEEKIFIYTSCIDGMGRVSIGSLEMLIRNSFKPLRIHGMGMYLAHDPDTLHVRQDELEDYLAEHLPQRVKRKTVIKGVSEHKLIRFIGALLVANYDLENHQHGEKINASSLAAKIKKDLSNRNFDAEEGLSDLHKIIPVAIESILKNKISEKK